MQLDIRAILVQEVDAREWRRNTAVRVHCVFDEIGTKVTVRRVFGIGDAHVVADRIGDLIDGPDSHGGLTDRFDPGVSRIPVLEYSAGLRPDLEILWSRARRPVGYDLRELIDLCPVLRAVSAVAAGDGNETLTVQAEAIATVVVDAIDGGILRLGHRATLNRRQPAKSPPYPQESIALA